MSAKLGYEFERNMILKDFEIREPANNSDLCRWNAAVMFLLIHELTVNTIF